MKRGTDHTWEIVKLYGDCAIYAECKCGYFYNVSLHEFDENGWKPPQKADVNKLTRYCPNCGARKLRYIPEVRCVKNRI